MARFFTCGFEENDLTSTIWTSTLPTAPTIQTTTVHSGTYALTKVTGTAGEVVRQLSAAITSGTTFTRFYFRKAGNPAFPRIIFKMTNTAANDSFRLLITGTGVLRLTNVAGGSTTFDGPTLSNNTWYRIEARHLISDTVGQIEVRVFSVSGTTETQTASSPFGDGNFTGGDGSDADTLNTNVQRWQWGTDSSFGSDVFFDDIIINDDTGVAPFNTWAGGSKIALVVPVSNNTPVDFEGTGGTTNWDRVDDLPGLPDDATTYNSEAVTLNSIDRLNPGGLPAEVTSDADMIAVDLYARVGSNAASPARTGRLKIWDETGALTNGPNVDFAINGWRILSVGPTNEHQPFDVAARTKANLNSFSYGYENITEAATRERRVTALWANVEWIEAVAGAAAVEVGHGMLLSGIRNQVIQHV